MIDEDTLSARRTALQTAATMNHVRMQSGFPNPATAAQVIEDAKAYEAFLLGTTSEASRG